MRNILNALNSKLKITSLQFCFAFGILLPASIASVQPNFSGNWKLNDSLSILASQYSYAPKILVITQNADSFTVEKIINSEGVVDQINEKHSLDGGVCTNKSILNGQSTSRALWNDEKISLWIYSSFDAHLDASVYYVESTEAYYLDDSSRLVIKASKFVPGALEMFETYVYDKQ